MTPPLLVKQVKYVTFLLPFQICNNLPQTWLPLSRWEHSYHPPGENKKNRLDLFAHLLDLCAFYVLLYKFACTGEHKNRMRQLEKKKKKKRLPSDQECSLLSCNNLCWLRPVPLMSPCHIYYSHRWKYRGVSKAAMLNDSKIWPWLSRCTQQGGTRTRRRGRKLKIIVFNGDIKAGQGMTDMDRNTGE